MTTRRLARNVHPSNLQGCTARFSEGRQNSHAACSRASAPRELLGVHGADTQREILLTWLTPKRQLCIVATDLGAAPRAAAAEGAAAAGATAAGAAAVGAAAAGLSCGHQGTG